MKNMRFQTKDLPERPILEFLAQHQGRWATHWPEVGGPGGMPVVPFPAWVPERLARAKLRKMTKKGLITGCDCGCRGDWEIEDRGLAAIGRARTAPGISTAVTVYVKMAPDQG